MQVNRLFEMVYLLLERKSMTAKELADKFEVSTRTIYRDIDVLSAAKVPIYANKGKGGGIYLLEEYVLNKSILSEEEQNQILFALQGMEKISKQEGNDVLEKMSTLFQKKNTNWIEIDFSHWSAKEKKDQTFEQIKEGILKQKVMECVYYNSYGQANQRRVEPLQIYFKDKAWYLKAYDQNKEDYRLFKISRMKQLKILEETFSRTLPKLPQERQEIPTITLELEIAKELSYRVYDEFEESEITKKENGDFFVKVEYPENDWIYGYLLSFGEQIKVNSPQRVKKQIEEKLGKMIKNYR